MKKILLLTLCLYLGGCGDSSQKQTYYTQLVEEVATLQGKTMQNDIPKAHTSDSKANVSEDAQALVSRAHTSGYELIAPKELSSHLDEYIIIATLPRGIYNLGLIPEARHFEFALSPSLNEDGSDWNWTADALGRAQEDFINLLGQSKEAKILFYDSGENIFSPVGSAHLGLLWAKHLGYTHLYRLIGGQNAWKDMNLPLSTQVPHCCQM